MIFDDGGGGRGAGGVGGPSKDADGGDCMKKKVKD